MNPQSVYSGGSAQGEQKQIENGHCSLSSGKLS